ncbi:phytoene desaturase family protein [Thermostaphylospora chromogena]|uniref:Phytoene desaturase n=1 Tax=Thermostaphylospora chromogena TaxID=35622 RepID=A0A1H1HZ60_9ACTN|nr:phytoene desaturase family protein [Thermostaphylospora chromogena]SDR30690.1 phytoene desaturase [Thermostaphylospora chromogena]
MAATRPVVVVGAGLGGLSAAVHLAAAGREVIVVEARKEPGGCCGTASVGPYRFDTGPSVLTMPSVLAEIFAAAGEDMDGWLPLRRLDPCYRLVYHDGSHLDVVPDAEAMTEQVRALCGPDEAARYRRFRALLGEMFQAEWSTFIDRDMTSLRSMVRPYTLLKLAAMGGFRRLDRLVAAHLTDERLIKAHTFQSLYVGLPPGQALGVYAVIAYMDTVGGVYFPRSGGMHAIPKALAALAEKKGAVIRYGVRAVEVETDGTGVAAVRLDTGERLATRHAVVACDLPRAHARLLPPAARDWRLRRPRFSPSCLVVHAGLDRRPPGQAHHTLHFGRQWAASFAALRQGRPQPDPSLLVTCPPAGDAAPAGHATLSVLEPAPNLSGGWSPGLTARLEERLLARLAELGYGDLSGAPRLVWDPPAWAKEGHSAGTPFALDHRFTQTAWLRPSGVARRVPGLHFAGMHTAPGVGVPPVLISGRLAAHRILGTAR